MFNSIFRSTLATETGANNPGLRLYKYDAESGKVMVSVLCAVTIMDNVADS